MYGGTASHQQLGNTTDLSILSPISDDIIVSCLRERFLNDQIYTRIGSHALVAVNPHKYVSSNADSVMLKYAAEYRDTSGEKAQPNPHIFQLADNAYYHMRRTGQDQSIVMTYVDFLLVSDLTLTCSAAEKHVVESQRTVDWLSRPCSS